MTGEHITITLGKNNTLFQKEEERRERGEKEYCPSRSPVCVKMPAGQYKIRPLNAYYSNIEERGKREEKREEAGEVVEEKRREEEKRGDDEVEGSGCDGNGKCCLRGFETTFWMHFNGEGEEKEKGEACSKIGGKDPFWECSGYEDCSRMSLFPYGTTGACSSSCQEGGCRFRFSNEGLALESSHETTITLQSEMTIVQFDFPLFNVNDPNTYYLPPNDFALFIQDLSSLSPTPPTPPTPPPTPPFTPPIDGPFVSVVDRLNAQFRDAVAEASSLSEGGVLVNMFDSFSQPGKPWLPCNLSWCREAGQSDRIACSLISNFNPKTINQKTGIILNTDVLTHSCSYVGDGDSYHKTCTPLGKSETCVPGCVDGVDSKPFCEVPKGCYWDVPYKPENLDWSLKHNSKGQYGSNEVVVDAEEYISKLYNPISSLDAIFFFDLETTKPGLSEDSDEDEEGGKRRNATKRAPLSTPLEVWEAAERELKRPVPLLSYDPSNLEAPFKCVRCPPPPPPPIPVVDRLNAQFRDATINAKSLTEAGILINMFDSFSEPGKPWLPCNLSWCREAKQSDRVACSLIGNYNVKTINPRSGIILNTDNLHHSCSYVGDGDSYHKMCTPLGKSETCIPGCVDGVDSKPFCEVPKGCYWDVPYKPENLDWCLQHNDKGQYGYNEVVVDAEEYLSILYNPAPSSSLDAIFYHKPVEEEGEEGDQPDGDDDGARGGESREEEEEERKKRKNSRFPYFGTPLEIWEAATEDLQRPVPLLMYDSTNLETPFECVRCE